MNYSAIDQLMAYTDWSKFVPIPTRFFASTGSMLVAAAAGGGYGLIGRLIYPKIGILPLHYAAWFAVAFQIKQVVELVERRIDNFLGVKDYLEELENTAKDELDLKDQIYCQCWQVIQLRNHVVSALDGIFSRIFHLRSYQEVKKDNVQEASFLEMCRYRMWPIFKSTVLDTIRFGVAYHLCNKVGIYLPTHTAVPLFLVIRSIVKDIILVPALYTYVKFCNHLAKELTEEDAQAVIVRKKWIYFCLPVL